MLWAVEFQLKPASLLRDWGRSMDCASSQYQICYAVSGTYVLRRWLPDGGRFGAYGSAFLAMVTFLNLFSLSLAVLSSSSVVRRWVHGI